MPRAFRNTIHATFALLLIVMVAVSELAGHVNQGLLDWSGAARWIFGIGVAVCAFLSLAVLPGSTNPLELESNWLVLPARRDSRWLLRFLIAAVSVTALWAVAWFCLLERAALTLEGPVSRESARLTRPLSHDPPVWCSLVSKVSTEPGLIGDICMERLWKVESHWVPLLGCVDLDARAIVEVRRTFLGPVVSLVEITDVPRHCENKRRKP
jgi:hypothetical protein